MQCSHLVGSDMCLAVVAGSGCQRVVDCTALIRASGSEPADGYLVSVLCAGDGSSLPVVRAADIEAVVSAWSGVPVERLTEDEMTKLVRLVSGGAVYLH